MRSGEQLNILLKVLYKAHRSADCLVMSSDRFFKFEILADLVFIYESRHILGVGMGSPFQDIF